MKQCILSLMLILALLTGTTVKLEITPAAILAEKYAKDFFPEQFEYTRHIEKYKKALSKRENSYKKLDSLSVFETLHLWPVEEQKRLKHIINLAKNDQSGDVYNYLREAGTDYAVNLNKVISLNEIYILERTIIKAYNEIKEAEEWATRVAAIVNYFNEDFTNGTLTKDIAYYDYILQIEKELQEVQDKYLHNVNLFILENEQKARHFFNRWRAVNKHIKPSPEREFFYLQLEQKIH